MCFLSHCEQHPSPAGNETLLGQGPLSNGTVSAPVVTPVAAQPPPSGGGIILFVALGLVLSCVVLASLGVALWLSKRLHSEEQLQVAATDMEHGLPRCSLESERGAPYLPKVPVIIVLPDNTVTNTSLSLGWEVESSPSSIPAAAKALRTSGSGSLAGRENDEEKPFTTRLSAALEQASSFTARLTSALEEGSTSSSRASLSAASQPRLAGMEAATGQQDAAVVPRRRRRAPIMSILVQAPDEPALELSPLPPPPPAQPPSTQQQP